MEWVAYFNGASVSRLREVRLRQTLLGQVAHSYSLLTSVKQSQFLELWVLRMSEIEKTRKRFGVSWKPKRTVPKPKTTLRSIKIKRERREETCLRSTGVGWSRVPPWSLENSSVELVGCLWRCRRLHVRRQLCCDRHSPLGRQDTLGEIMKM